MLRERVTPQCGCCFKETKSTEQKEHGPPGTAIFFGVSFLFVVFSGLLYAHMCNLTPKPLFFLLICVTKAFLWGDENILKLDCGDG